jgi:hypothetical protein
MRTILLFFYTLSMATVSAFLVLDKIVVYPTTDVAVRITLNVTLALFILALITGAYFRWKWSRLAGHLHQRKSSKSLETNELRFRFWVFM